MSGRWWKCGICNEKVGGGAIACIKCRTWIHFKCGKVKRTEATKLKNGFVCPNCADGELECSNNGHLHEDLNPGGECSHVNTTQQEEEVETEVETDLNPGGECSHVNTTQQEEEMETEVEADFVREVGEPIRKGGNMAVMKNNLIIAECFIRPTPANLHVDEDEACIQITKTFEDKLKQVNMRSLKVNAVLMWKQRGLQLITKKKILKINDTVRVFYNDLNIGTGTIEALNETDDEPIKLHVKDVFQKNIVKSNIQEERTDFLEGDIIEWNAENVEILQDFPQKKRLKPDSWKKNIEKSKRAKGLEYITSKGNVKAAKVVENVENMPTCSCKEKCPEKISINEQRVLRNFYYENTEYAAKNAYLFGLIERKDCKTSITSERKKTRNNEYDYYLTNDKKEKVKVCQEMFLKTFGVTKKRLRVVRQKKYADRSFEDSIVHGSCGKAPGNAYPEDVCADVIQFLQRFPAVPSHYNRKNSRKFYFERGLNLTKMYELYKERNDIVEHVSLSKFKSIIADFNVGFHKTKKDACKQCTAFKHAVKTDEARKNQKEHFRRKEMSRQEKDRDIEKAQRDDNYLAIIVDMEQVSQCPKANSSEFFYVSKISCYNFSIYDLGSHEGYCYRWDERKSMRGTNETGSCLKHFLNEMVSEDVNEVSIWSDACGGQNRSQYISAVLVNVIEDTSNNIKVITQKYFESGHSQSEVDTIHSSLDGALKEVDEIYLPSDYRTITKMARPKQAFHYLELGINDIPVYDVKAYSKQKIKNRNTYLDAKDKRCEVQWMKTKMIHYGKSEDSAEIGFSYNFDYDEKIITINSSGKPSKKRKTTRRSNIESTLKVIVDDSTEYRKLSAKKVRGLLGLVNGGQIPRSYHYFYRGLNAHDESSSDEELETESENSDDGDDED